MKRTVVIGATRRQWLPAKVCEYTVRIRTSVELDIIHTFDKKYGDTTPLTAMNRTGFSFVRFAVPELAGYQGRALYMDSDMLVMKDLNILFGLSLHDASILRPKNQTAILLYDCERLNHWNSSEYLRRLETGQYQYRQLMESLYEPRLGIGIPDQWNHMDVYVKGFTGILHYTDMARQPWLYARNPLASYWFEALRGAIKGEFVSVTDVEREVKAGHVGDWVLKEAKSGRANA